MNSNYESQARGFSRTHLRRGVHLGNSELLLLEHKAGKDASVNYPSTKPKITNHNT
jgi:hypothetical protein